MTALLFVLYLVVEIAALVGLAQLIGVGWALLVLVAVSGVGLLLLGAQGKRVFERFRRASRGEVSAESAVADGLIVATGSILLFVPGLVTGVIGLLALFPPTRALLRPVLEKLGTRRFGPLPSFAPSPYRGVVVDAEGDVVDGVVVGQWYDDGHTGGPRALGSA
ncbi:FxsA family protein [Nocardia mangyaensis]|uniref:FxsA family protein n=1 Tax=Nocardia mangyaensis TaxID=2213200 RepID=UPI0026764282|nr:FxsA family protein [Nocardia mangyaensis]MDO3649531.1 FxsA family protein [Nocardia mangyaensis]